MGLVAGSVHTYTVDAVDGATNVSELSLASDPITVFDPPPDVTPPTTPGQPAGTSTSAGQIDLTWGASTDQSPPITYRIYRDGGASPVGQTTGTAFSDMGLPQAHPHVHRGRGGRRGDERERDELVSDPITVVDPLPDVTPPTTPGVSPRGTSTSAGQIDLSWSASTDDSPPITYRIYRDGDTSPIVETTATTYSDMGLAAGSIHTYTVDAVDAATNVSEMSLVSDPITVFSPPTFIFADDFSTGNFANWTGVTRLTIDPGQGSVGFTERSGAGERTERMGVPHARCDVRVGLLERRCERVIPRGEHGRPVPTPDGDRWSDLQGPPLKSGVLVFRSDVSGVQRSSGVALGSGWHNVELCGTVGSAGAWDLYRDGVKIVNGWVANTGSTPIGRIQIGDTAAKTFTANWDDVRLDLVAG